MRFKILITLALLFVLAVPLVSSIEEGDNLTQRQVDRIDVDALNITSLGCQKENRRTIIPSFVYSCLTIAERNNNLFEVVRQDHKIEFKTLFLAQAIERFGVENLITRAPALIDRHIDSTVEEIRENIRAYQFDSLLERIRRWLFAHDPF